VRFFLILLNKRAQDLRLPTVFPRISGALLGVDTPGELSFVRKRWSRSDAISAQ
jgi:hypothetical protein